MKWKIFFVIILSIFLVACSDKENVPEGERQEEAKTPVATAADEPDKPEEKTEPEITAPFTGLPVEEELTNRMVAVMVNNHPSARPQTSLSKADIVFEILAEGNITRFMALYHSEIPDKVGPVRSARPYYFNLADDYGAMYVYHGAIYFIEDMIKTGAADGLNGMYYDNDKVLFERSSDRVAPHNSYAYFDGIYQRAEENGYETEQTYESLLFSDEEVDGNKAEDIQFSYGNYTVRYVYDENADQYVRYSDGEQTVEYSENTPIEISNVLILETAHQVVDDVGRREIDMESGGDALLLQKGKVQNVQWERIDGRIIPTIDGEVVPLVPGKTWVNVIPENPGIEGVIFTE
ncbi:Protein of unknown function [Gracilibacillus ureilyticus]|uniref:DUF3048 domain-containing protein n=1 Tax=Gracilibacillus ureilyticus TaxID=531814 RepID=A0A1H9QW10_9BACI|nr:DUF3048 domain-containing protein [Gracilibacillus ureilyticus]SER64019.1 Protein of unknown function [Gracilibacillus ureilyticus]